MFVPHIVYLNPIMYPRPSIQTISTFYRPKKYSLQRNLIGLKSLRNFVSQVLRFVSLITRKIQKLLFARNAIQDISFTWAFFKWPPRVFSPNTCATGGGGGSNMDVARAVLLSVKASKRPDCLPLYKFLNDWDPVPPHSLPVLADTFPRPLLACPDGSREDQDC
ncbi:hypothetical protein BDW69DRAFT_178464 [Aspergillus filifer]